MLKILEFFLGISLTKIVSIGVAIIFYGVIIAYAFFVFDIIHKLYNSIVSLGDYFNNPSGGELFSKIFGLLSCSGILDGLQSAQTFIVPSLTVLLVAYGSRIVFGVKKQLTDAILKITS